MKRAGWPALLFAGMLAAMSWFALEVGLVGNVGLPVGYYGKHNIAKAEVAKIPGVRVEGERLHRDWTLEDSSIHVIYRGRPIELRFDWEMLPPDVDPRQLLVDLAKELDAHVERGAPDEPLRWTSDTRRITRWP